MKNLNLFVLIIFFVLTMLMSFSCGKSNKQKENKNNNVPVVNNTSLPNLNLSEPDCDEEVTYLGDKISIGNAFLIGTISDIKPKQSMLSFNCHNENIDYERIEPAHCSSILPPIILEFEDVDFLHGDNSLTESPNLDVVISPRHLSLYRMRPYIEDNDVLFRDERRFHEGQRMIFNIKIQDGSAVMVPLTEYQVIDGDIMWEQKRHCSVLSESIISILNIRDLYFAVENSTPIDEDIDVIGEDLSSLCTLSRDICDGFSPPPYDIEN